MCQTVKVKLSKSDIFDTERELANRLIGLGNLAQEGAAVLISRIRFIGYSFCHFGERNLLYSNFKALF